MTPNQLRTLTLTALLTAPTAFAGSGTFDDVWSATQDGPYATLPQHRTSFASFFSQGLDLLRRSVDRTLDDDADVLPRFQKLVHPVGICFAGTWSIDAPSPYTGYFAQGARGLIIVRASEALGTPDRGDYRAFGLAGKLFPTTDGAAPVAATANFFTIDDLGGTRAASYLDDDKTNEPKTSLHASQLAIFPTLTHVAKTFAKADANPGIRQVYEIAELGLADPTSARTPHWFAVRADNTERNGATDFRDELRLASYPAGLSFGVFVAEDDGAGFTRLGTIKLDREALSDGCDHRLHFHHPRAK